MTRTDSPRSLAGDKQFTRDVAKQLDRRRIRRRMTIWSALLGLIVAAAAYLRCGSGFGLGTGTGTGKDDDHAAVRPVTGPRRCTVRIGPDGIAVNGKPMSRDDAVDACKATTGVDAVVTGDARQGDWQELRAALVAAGVQDIRVREPVAPGGSASSK
ncbi:MAG TPA: hypothetical protein VLM79_15315 [Kofleriaceae bacterium]|nr:hypothetical protein [Kofleriaceae bacterium]